MKKSERTQRWRSGIGNSEVNPRQTLRQRFNTPQEPDKLRQFANSILSQKGHSTQSNLIAIESLIEAGYLEEDPNTACTDIASAVELAECIITREIDATNMLSADAIKTALLYSYGSTHQSLILTNELPNRKLQEKTYSELQRIAQHLSDNKERHRNGAQWSEYIGVEAELLALLAVHRLAIQNNSETNWQPVPTTFSADRSKRSFGHTENGDGSINNGWDISIICQSPGSNPEITHKLQIKSRSSVHTYDPSIVTLIMNDYLVDPYGKQIRSIKTLEYFALEGQRSHQTRRSDYIGDYLDFVGANLMTTIDSHSAQLRLEQDS